MMLLFILSLPWYRTPSISSIVFDRCFDEGLSMIPTLCLQSGTVSTKSPSPARWLIGCLLLPYNIESIQVHIFSDYLIYRCISTFLFQIDDADICQNFTHFLSNTLDKTKSIFVTSNVFIHLSHWNAIKNQLFHFPTGRKQELP